MGLDLKQVHEVLGTGAAASFMFGDRGQRMVDGDFDDVRSALTIFVKDMGLVSEAADRKSTRLNSSHVASSYAVFCLKKKNIPIRYTMRAANDTTRRRATP